MTILVANVVKLDYEPLPDGARFFIEKDGECLAEEHIGKGRIVTGGLDLIDIYNRVGKRARLLEHEIAAALAQFITSATIDVDILDALSAAWGEFEHVVACVEKVANQVRFWLADDDGNVLASHQTTDQELLMGNWDIAEIYRTIGSTVDLDEKVITAALADLAERLARSGRSYGGTTMQDAAAEMWDKISPPKLQDEAIRMLGLDIWGRPKLLEGLEIPPAFIGGMNIIHIDEPGAEELLLCGEDGEKIGRVRYFDPRRMVAVVVYVDSENRGIEGDSGTWLLEEVPVVEILRRSDKEPWVGLLPGQNQPLPGFAAQLQNSDRAELAAALGAWKRDPNMELITFAEHPEKEVFEIKIDRGTVQRNPNAGRNRYKIPGETHEDPGTGKITRSYQEIHTLTPEPGFFYTYAPKTVACCYCNTSFLHTELEEGEPACDCMPAPDICPKCKTPDCCILGFEKLSKDELEALAEENES